MRELTFRVVAPGHDSRDGLRRVVALPGAQGRHDGQRVDSGGGHLDHALPRHLQAAGSIRVSRDATILENNIVQTAGSAGESIAFGVGVTMPAIMILGFDLEITRVMLVAVLGGLLGILMMIPLRRALIVEQHGKLKYPEGTACAEVLKAGASRRIARHGLAGAEARSRRGSAAAGLASGTSATHDLHRLRHRARLQDPDDGVSSAGRTRPKRSSGSRSPPASMSAEISPELLGVGYIIGPRIASSHVRGRRAGVPGADSADQVLRRGHDRAARAGHDADLAR